MIATPNSGDKIVVVTKVHNELCVNLNFSTKAAVCICTCTAKLSPIGRKYAKKKRRKLI